MNQRGVYTRRVEMSFGRRGGLWTAVLAVLSGIVVIALAILFSVLFLGLLGAIAVGLVVRGWLLGRPTARPAAGPRVIEAEYTVIDSGDPAERRPRP